MAVKLTEKKASKQTAWVYSFLSALGGGCDVTSCFSSCLGFPELMDCVLEL